MVMERWRPTALRPWARPSRAFDEVERYMDELMGNWPFRTWRRLPLADMSWAPPVEVYEKDDRFVVRTELPGVDENEIDISLLGETLTIKGERRICEDVSEEDYHRSEICYGNFSRSVTLPSAVDVDKIAASYDSGVLEIVLPKAKETKPSKIQVKAGSQIQGKAESKPRTKAKSKTSPKKKTGPKPKNKST